MYRYTVNIYHSTCSSSLIHVCAKILHLNSLWLIQRVTPDRMFKVACLIKSSCVLQNINKHYKIKTIRETEE